MQSHRGPTRYSIYKTLLTAVAVWAHLPRRVHAGNSNYQTDTSVYGVSMQRDWLYENSRINIKVEGCAWGYVDGDERENMACMDDSSEDGTTYWYMMANCRRAQVVYSMYAGSSSSCKNGLWKESLVTKTGVAEFAYTLGTYGYNPPISGDDVSSLPICDSDGNGFYIGAGCSSNGKFTIDRFTDQYCTQYYDTYDTLSNLNSAMNSISCYNVYNANYDESFSYSVAKYLLAESATCSSSESELCKDSDFVSSSGYGNSVATSARTTLSSGSSFANKLKYGLGTAMLVGSVIMFFGILFTNRKKRRAMMHRKFKHKSSDKKKKKSGRSSSSKKRSSSSAKKSNSGVFA